MGERQKLSERVAEVERRLADIEAVQRDHLCQMPDLAHELCALKMRVAALEDSKE